MSSQAGKFGIELINFLLATSFYPLCSLNIKIQTDDLDPSHDIDNADAVMHTSKSQIQQSATSVTKSKDISKSNKSSLVQATISTLFKKVEEKVKSSLLTHV